MSVLADHGRQRLELLGAGRVLALAMLAGSFITAGALLSVVLSTGTANAGLAHIIEGVAFSTGFFFVILSGAVLFTETNVVMPAILLGRGRSVARVLRFWALAWLGNLAGAAFMASLLAFATDLSPDTQALLRAKVLVKTSAVGQGALAWGAVVVSGVLANWLVGMAAFFATMGRTIPGKFVPVALVVTTFVALGLQHSPANMGFFALEASFSGDLDVGATLLWNLVPAGLGNVIGGGVGVAVLLSWAFSPFGIAVSLGQTDPEGVAE